MSDHTTSNSKPIILIIVGLIVLFAILWLTGIIDFDADGDVALPDVEVEADVSGGELPDVDVETADIDVGMEEVEIEVPEVDIDPATDDGEGN